LRLNQPIVGMARTPRSRGYWLVAADGGVFSFGDARFRGSTATLPLRRPIIGMATTRTGSGYWLVASDGGVFSFGDARFLGSGASRGLAAPVTGFTASNDGRAYWMTTASGKVLGFGRVSFATSSATRNTRQVLVGLARSGGSWRIVGADGRPVRLPEWGSRRSPGRPGNGRPPTDPPRTTPSTVSPPPTTSPPTTSPSSTTPSTTSPPPTTTPPSTNPPPTNPPPDPTPPPTYLSSNITDYIELRGDQVVTVPDGRYRAGDVNAPHAATAGAYKGWLVLRAQSMHGVVVDLRGAELELGERTTRVAFVGFKFVNGSIRIKGQDLAFWYTDHTFPAREWVDQAADERHPERGYYRAPRTIYADEGTVRRVNFYGTDVHDTGTAMLVSRSKQLQLRGVHMWDLSDDGLDPQDVVHPDAIGGVAGQSEDLTVLDSWIQGRIMLIDANGSKTSGGPHRNLRFENVWVSHSPSGGFTFTSRKPAAPWGIFGTRTNIRSWGHNNGLDRLEIIDGRQIRDANTQPSRVNVVDRGIVKSAPAANEPSPAAVWRTSNPYGDWADVLF
jgi:hypothetical protein